MDCKTSTRWKYLEGTTSDNLLTLSIGLVHEIEEFKNPKSKSQYIIELKELNKYMNEFVWDFDEQFKTFMANVSFGMNDVEHK